MKKPLGKKIFKLIFTILAVIASIALIIVAVVFALRMKGKKSLMENTRSIPAIDLSISAGSVDITQVGQLPESAKRQLKEGEVLYKDKIYSYNRDVICMLFMGIDKKGELSKAKDGMDGGQADALFLLIFNPHNKVYSVLTINRNTMTDIDVFDKAGNFVGTRKAQITLQHGYGDGMEISCERQIRTVSRFMHNIPIHAYAAINVAAIPALNDAVGGVDVTALEDIKHGKVDWKAGQELHLMGEDARTYVQYRDVDVFASNEGRFARQKQYMAAFVGRTRELLKSNPGLGVDLYNIAMDYMVTDIDVSRVTYMTTEFLDYSMNEKGIMSVPGQLIQGVEFEEYYADDEAVKDLVVELFYEPVEE